MWNNGIGRGLVTEPTEPKDVNRKLEDVDCEGEL